MPQKGQPIRQETEKRQQQPAQRQEISAAAQCKRQTLIDPQFPISPEDRKEKQKTDGGKPEKQIQQHR